MWVWTSQYQDIGEEVWQINSYVVDPLKQDTKLPSHSKCHCETWQERVQNHHIPQTYDLYDFRS